LAEAERQVDVQAGHCLTTLHNKCNGTQVRVNHDMTYLCLPPLIFFLCLSVAIPAESIKGRRTPFCTRSKPVVTMREFKLSW
jgi:hypothetical protein